MSKIGLGITTYKRPEYFKQCMEAVLQNCPSADYIVVYNDGSDLAGYNEIYQKILLDGRVRVIHDPINKGVAVAKNVLLKDMISRGCDSLFLLEDDIIVKSDKALTEYVRIGEEYGYHNLCYALHGPANIGNRVTGDSEISYYPNSVGAFCYYSKQAIEKCGYFDENFHNAMEHVELTHRISLQGMTQSFAMFPDVAKASDYLGEIKGSIENSSIRPTDEKTNTFARDSFRKNIWEALKYWKEKAGHRFPLWDLYYEYKKYEEAK